MYWIVEIALLLILVIWLSASLCATWFLIEEIIENREIDWDKIKKMFEKLLLWPVILSNKLTEVKE